jgi:uncharacterized coiled-coil DUF342 family protein
MSDGKGCQCNAHCEHECFCDADWTTKEVYDLRAELARLTDERDALAAELAAMQKQRDEADAECREANASWCREIEESIDLNRELASMREQRDEARRELCIEILAHLRIGQAERADEHLRADRLLARLLAARQFAQLEAEARRRGWDCFKESKS